MALLSPGTLFAGYRIEGVLGRGGMGVIYRATEVRPQRSVALKVVAPDLAQDMVFRDRFLRESQVAATLEHPHVVPVLRVDEVDDMLFIAMRLVRGSDLWRLIRTQRELEPRRASRIVDQIADALDTAHELGLVHRDVKPSNVLVEQGRRGEHVYLTDFGLTKRLSSTGGLTETGTIVGTVDYMAPEQLKGERVDARADIYSLGCVLYHSLTGGIPYPRDRIEAAMFAHLTAPPPAVSERVAGCPGEFDEIIARALAKHPDERYPSAGDLGFAALAAAEGRPTTRPERSVASGAAAPAGSEAAGSAAGATGSAGVAAGGAGAAGASAGAAAPREPVTAAPEEHEGSQAPPPTPIPTRAPVPPKEQAATTPPTPEPARPEEPPPTPAPEPAGGPPSVTQPPESSTEITEEPEVGAEESSEVAAESVSSATEAAATERESAIGRPGSTPVTVPAAEEGPTRRRRRRRPAAFLLPAIALVVAVGLGILLGGSGGKSSTPKTTSQRQAIPTQQMAAITGILRTVDAGRSTGHTNLVKAKDSNGQSKAAQSISTAYQRGVRSMSQLPPGTRSQPAVQAVSAALSASAAGYAQLARAAKRHNNGAYKSGAASVRSDEQQLGLAVKRLAAAG